MVKSDSSPLPPVELGPVVYVEHLDRLDLHPDDRHHLERVLRVRRGDPVVCADGAGRWVACRLGPVVEPAGAVVRVPRRLPRVRVGFALVKGSKPELICQKLSEVGVDRIVPFVADRSIVRWDDERSDRNHERLVRVALAAAAQSRRVWLPEVEAVTEFATLAAGPRVALADLDGELPDDEPDTVLVGPEGGWSPAERHAVPRHLCFGVQVMRAETAAIVVGATLVGLRSGLVRRAAADRDAGNAQGEGRDARG